MSALSRGGLTRWRESLDRQVELGETPGLVALAWRHGEAHVHTAGVQSVESRVPMARDTLFRIASMTKPVAAAAAMALVEEGAVSLDDAVDPWLPELADRQVLRRVDGPVEDTVPAERAITLRDLMTLRMGLGYLFTPDTYPIHTLLELVPILKGPPLPTRLPAPDEWMAGVGSLPLMCQPGDQWQYDVGLDLLGVLIARVSGQSLDGFMRERIFAPLGMNDTAFHVPVDKRNRLATSYSRNPETAALEVYDGAEDSAWGAPPAFPAAASGLVSTVDDYLAFCRMLLEGGGAVLRPDSVAIMTTNQLTEAQRASGQIILGPHSGWGFGMAVDVDRSAPSFVPGRFGWDGGLGTSARVDPENGLIGILLTQQMMESASPPPAFTAFWASLYQAL